MTNKRICDTLGLSYTFVKEHKINYRSLVYKVRDYKLGRCTSRDVKNQIYGMYISERQQDTLWNAFVRTYLSHVSINIVPIKDKHSNTHISLREFGI